MATIATQLNSGSGFAAGETVTATKLNNLVNTATPTYTSAGDTDDSTLEISGNKFRVKDGGIVAAKLATGAVTGAAGGGKLAASAITDQTALDALANADSLLIHDDSTSALRKVTWSQIVAAAQPVGSVLKTVQSENSTFTTLTVGIPDDNTIPQNTEGTEVLTATITPSSASNKILITACIQGNTGLDIAGYVAVAVFADANADALAVSYAQSFRTMNPSAPIVYLHSPNTTSAITYKVRVGTVPSGNFYLNGDYLGNAKFGGTMRSTLTLQEIKG